jgi:hypothetical protein
MSDGRARKKAAAFMLALIIFSLQVSSDQEEECVKVEASISPRWLSRGQEGKVVLKIKLAEGITINPQPSFIIECNTTEELIFPKNFFTASDLEIAIKEENGKEVLDFKDPVEIPFTVSLESKRGNHTFGGKIKYFAFSKQESWCLKSSVKFQASFYTRRARVK